MMRVVSSLYVGIVVEKDEGEVKEVRSMIINVITKYSFTKKSYIIVLYAKLIDVCRYNSSIQTPVTYRCCRERTRRRVSSALSTCQVTRKMWFTRLL
jgi:hypothetical protein